MTKFSAPEIQKAIFLKGISGEKPVAPLSYPKLKAAAKQKMSPEAWAYMAGGAGLEKTMTANRQVFDRYQILPRMLRDVSERDTSIELFGQRLPSPFLICPIGVLELAHPAADKAVAQAAASLGMPYIFSNQASVPMEACAAVMGEQPHWFQLYWSKSNELVESFVRRAEACGCSAIVLTLDTTLLGWRVRDLDLGYVPFLEGKGMAQYTSDPVFQRLIKEWPVDTTSPVKRKITLTTLSKLAVIAESYPGNSLQNLVSKTPREAIRLFTQIYSRPSLTWEDLPILRKMTRLPILLKGIQHPDDARRAVDSGMDGLIVSNHGGRQVDGAIGALDALPGVVEAVGGQLPVLMDSGIRSGADVFKALALGAHAVCIGRPYVYGLALAGAAGVRQVLEGLWADFELAMGLAGCRDVGEINREMLR